MTKPGRKEKGQEVSILVLIYVLLAISLWIAAAMQFMGPGYFGFLLGTILLIHSIILNVYFIVDELNTTSGFIGFLLGIFSWLCWFGGHIANAGSIAFNDIIGLVQICLTIGLTICGTLLFWQVYKFSQPIPPPSMCPHCGLLLRPASQPGQLYCTSCKKTYRRKT